MFVSFGNIYIYIYVLAEKLSDVFVIVIDLELRYLDMPLRKKSRKNNPSDTSSCKGKRVEDLNSVDRDSTGAFGIIRTLSCTIHPLEKRKPSKECENICSGLTDAGMEKKPELIACNGKVQKSTSDGNSNSREVCSRCNSPPKSSVPSINRMNCPDYLESPSFPAKSPTFKIEDYTPTDFSRATVLAMHPNLQNDFIPIAELSESPKRYRNTSDLAAKDGDSYLTTVPLDALQINTSIMAEEHDYAMNLPSSPLLVAVKSAVDSLNQYEDFDILEQIGVGFFAEVFKVSFHGDMMLFVVASCSYGYGTYMKATAERPHNVYLKLRPEEHADSIHVVCGCESYKFLEIGIFNSYQGNLQVIQVR